MQDLDLCGRELKTLPPKLFDRTQLVSLFLDDNYLSHIPEEFTRLSGLETLKLDRNHLSSWPQVICNLTKLRILHLDGNFINAIHPNVQKLAHLEELLLENNQISSIPPQFFQLHNLKILYLSSNSLTEISQEICTLKHLEILQLSNNWISSLPKNLGNLTKLQILNVDNNLLESVPISLTKCKSVKLFVRNNRLRSIPPQIIEAFGAGSVHSEGNPLVLQGKRDSRYLAVDLSVVSRQNSPNSKIVLPNAVFGSSQNLFQNVSSNAFSGSIKLELQGRKLKDGDIEKIFSQTTLEQLYLDYNELRTVPDDIGLLVNLKELYLNNNNLNYLTREVGRLLQLEILQIESNNLKELPNTLIKCTCLRHLYAGNNQLETLPEGFGNLTSLQVLHLENNHLVSLPSEIGNLKALKLLSVHSNKLVSLPASLEECAQLVWIYANNNQISNIPADLSKLEHLAQLFLGGNGLSDLPIGLSKCNLDVLDLYGNPLGKAVGALVRDQQNLLTRVRDLSTIVDRLQHMPQDEHNKGLTQRKPSLASERLTMGLSLPPAPSSSTATPRDATATATTKDTTTTATLKDTTTTATLKDTTTAASSLTRVPSPPSTSIFGNLESDGSLSESSSSDTETKGWKPNEKETKGWKTPTNSRKVLQHSSISVFTKQEIALAAQNTRLSMKSPPILAADRSRVTSEISKLKKSSPLHFSSDQVIGTPLSPILPDAHFNVMKEKLERVSEQRDIATIKLEELKKTSDQHYDKINDIRSLLFKARAELRCVSARLEQNSPEIQRCIRATCLMDEALELSESLVRKVNLQEASVTLSNSSATPSELMRVSKYRSISVSRGRSGLPALEAFHSVPISLNKFFKPPPVSTKMHRAKSEPALHVWERTFTKQEISIKETNETITTLEPPQPRDMLKSDSISSDPPAVSSSSRAMLKIKSPELIANTGSVNLKLGSQGERYIESGDPLSIWIWSIEHSNEDVFVVLATFRTVTTAEAMLNKVIERFKFYDSLMDSDRLGLQRHLMHILRYWIENYHYIDFQKGSSCSEILKGFLESVQEEALNKEKEGVTEKLAQKESGISATASGENDTTLEPASSTVTISPVRKRAASIVTGLLKLSSTNVKNLELLNIHALDLAHYITLKEFALFKDIPIAKLAMGETYQKDAIKECANHFNLVSAWIAYEILSCVHIKQRIIMIKYFIQVASVLANIRNFSSLFQVLAAFNLSCVERLKATWKALPKSQLKQLEQLQVLMESTNNYKQYRRALKQSHPPTIPYLGLLLKDFLSLDFALKTNTVAGWNFRKAKSLSDFIRGIQKFQAVPYSFRYPSIVSQYVQKSLKNEKGLCETNLRKMSLICEPSGTYM